MGGAGREEKKVWRRLNPVPPSTRMCARTNENATWKEDGVVEGAIKTRRNQRGE